MSIHMPVVLLASVPFSHEINFYGDTKPMEWVPPTTKKVTSARHGHCWFLVFYCFLPSDIAQPSLVGIAMVMVAIDGGQPRRHDC